MRGAFIIFFLSCFFTNGQAYNSYNQFIKDTITDDFLTANYGSYLSNESNYLYRHYPSLILHNDSPENGFNINVTGTYPYKGLELRRSPIPFEFDKSKEDEFNFRLNSFPNLLSLSIGACIKSIPEGLDSLKLLRSLYLNAPYLESLNCSLNKLKNLLYLTIVDTKPSDMKQSLGGVTLEMLKYLSVSEGFNDFVKELPETFTARRIDFQGFFKEAVNLSELPFVEHLFLDDANPSETLKDFSTIKGCEKLKFLHLKNIFPTSKSFKERLSVLYLDNHRGQFKKLGLSSKYFDKLSKKCDVLILDNFSDALMSKISPDKRCTIFLVGSSDQTSFEKAENKREISYTTLHNLIDYPNYLVGGIYNLPYSVHSYSTKKLRSNNYEITPAESFQNEAYRHVDLLSPILEKVNSSWLKHYESNDLYNWGALPPYGEVGSDFLNSVVVNKIDTLFSVSGSENKSIPVKVYSDDSYSVLNMMDNIQIIERMNLPSFNQDHIISRLLSIENATIEAEKLIFEQPNELTDFNQIKIAIEKAMNLEANFASGHTSKIQSNYLKSLWSYVISLEWEYEHRAPYRKLINVANKKLSEENYQKALELFRRAALFDPSDPHPKKQIELIESILEKE